MTTDPKHKAPSTEDEENSNALLEEHPLTVLVYFFIFWQGADLCTNASLPWIKCTAAVLLIAAPFAFCLLIRQWAKEKEAQDS